MNHHLGSYEVSITTDRDAGPEHFEVRFFWIDCGIKVENSSNTFIVHRSDMLHGSRLHGTKTEMTRCCCAAEGFGAKRLEYVCGKQPGEGLARHEKYGNGTTGEDEDGEDFDPKRSKECEVGRLQGYII